MHVCMGTEVVVCAFEDAEILAQCTHNEALFVAKLYRPEDALWGHFEVMEHVLRLDICNLMDSTRIVLDMKADRLIKQWNFHF